MNCVPPLFLLSLLGTRRSAIERRSRYVTLPRKQNFWMTTNPNCHLKSDSHCFKLYVTCHLSFVTLIWQMLAKFSGVEFERTASKFTGLFIHSIKLSREMRKIHVAVVQRWLRNVQKSVMHVRSCFANINLFLFCRFRCRRRCRCQSSLLLWSRNSGTMVTWRHTSPLYWTFFFARPQ